MTTLKKYGVLLMNAIHKEYVKKIKREKNIILFLQIFIIFFFMFLWDILAYFNIIDTFIFSSPKNIFSLMIAYLKTSELLRHAFV